MNSGVNGSTHISSTPSSATSSALRSSEVRIAGCDPGRTTSEGCGSKVSSRQDRKSTRLNSSHANISYAVFCLKKKKKRLDHTAAVANSGGLLQATALIW